ncbi:hypothetical protein BDV41DRAFT_571100 [Aspergillus transmontanensis]|uniref:Uncharacterized protein n=1 Tax=Aspergillus transmontanensis TaxID=1034304 RepID=A0A5N6WG07_9EURO|nr:hypothetical protein BDV41DRAFT_571100 [Aspergillus transmontanensis]
MGRKSNRNRKGNVGQINDVGVRVVLAYRFSAPATEVDLTRDMKRKASSVLREDSLPIIRDGDDVVVGNNEGFILTREMRRQDEELERPHWFAKMVRQRFLLTYKRDKLHTASDEDCDLIRKVNKKVHGGNALADADYTGIGVDRITTSTRSYVSQGMDIIDEHATFVAADDRECSPKFEELFQKYLRDLEAAEYPHDFLFE